jgi:hypothetical protein
VTTIDEHRRGAEPITHVSTGTSTPTSLRLRWVSRAKAGIRTSTHGRGRNFVAPSYERTRDLRKGPPFGRVRHPARGTPFINHAAAGTAGGSGALVREGDAVKMVRQPGPTPKKQPWRDKHTLCRGAGRRAPCEGSRLYAAMVVWCVAIEGFRRGCGGLGRSASLARYCPTIRHAPAERFASRPIDQAHP